MKTSRLLILLTLGLSLASCNVKPAEEHRFSGTFEYDEEYHWEKCLDSGCDYIRNKGQHDLEVYEKRDATCTQDGYIIWKCKTCEYSKFQSLTDGGHTYDYGVYYHDNIYHWNECDKCHEKKYTEEHTFTEWDIIKEATTTAEGLKTRLCNKCGYEQTERIPLSVHIYDEDVWNYNDTYHWHDCSHCSEHISQSKHEASDWIIDKNPTESTAGAKHKECRICGYIMEEALIPFKSSETVNFYAINDFHGEVDKISKVMGYLKARKAEENTIIINSGDSYQGSLISNANYGQLLTKCMNAVGFDEITVGNHDFDWGLDPLSEIIDTANMPYLGANVYHYDFDTGVWGDFASEYFEKYTIKTLDSGIKVGIIGVIGAGQITSICTQFVKTIGFANPVPIVRSLAQELREEKGCDIVVCSAHCDASGVNGLTKNDVDALFLGHTHQKTEDTSSLPKVQAGGYGNYVSNITLTVNNETGTVSCDNVSNIRYSTSWPNEPTCDQLITEERAIRDVEASEVLATDVPYLSTSSGGKFIAHMMAETALEQGYDIDLAITNVARDTFSGGAMTYEDLYNVVPFDNVVYIAKVKGSDLVYEGEHNYIYRINPDAFNNSSYSEYTIAVIDYLLLHCDSGRKYNYFSKGFEIIGQLESKEYSLYNYRYITRDYLRKQTPNFNDYTSTNNRNDRSSLEYDVSF